MAPRRRTRLVKLDGSSIFRSARKQKLREYFEEKKGKMSFEDEVNDEDDYHRPMTRAEIESYNKQIEETGGFDVDVPPEVYDTGVIHPDPDFDKDPWMLEKLNRCSRMAIDVYNKKYKKAKYEFMRVLKVCSAMAAGYVHYITFEAKAEGAAPTCFQAIVFAGITEDNIKVIMSRPKPSS